MNGRRFRTIVAVFVLIGVFYAPVFHVQQAEAQLGTFAGIVANCIITTTIRAILQVAISALLFFLLGFVPTADPGDLGNFIKEYIKDPIMRCIVRSVLDEAIGSMLEVVRKKGRDGAASYIRNWRNFQTQAQYRGEDTFRAIVANTDVCPYLRDGAWEQLGVTSAFRVSLQGINIRIGNLHPFTLRAKCPLPSNFNLVAYGESPTTNGGWAAFNRMLSPSGNSLGWGTLSQSELNSQRREEEKADVNEGLSGAGFLGTRGSTTAGSGGPTTVGLSCTADADCGAGAVCGEYRCGSAGVIGSGGGEACNPAFGCPSGGVCRGTCTAPSGSTGNAANEPSCLLVGPNGKCIRYADVRSPASYIRETVAAQIQQEMAWLTNVDEINELVVGWIWTRLTNRLMDLGADEEKPTYGSDDYSAPAGPTGPAPSTSGPPGTCFEDPNCDCSGNNDTFHGDVIAAIDQVIADDRASQTIFEHSVLGGLRNRPHIRDGQSVAYLNAVLAKLAGRGYTGISPDNTESIAIVRNGVEQIFDIIQAGGWTWASQGSVCTPPHFN